MEMGVGGGVVEMVVVVVGLLLAVGVVVEVAEHAGGRVVDALTRSRVALGFIEKRGSVGGGGERSAFAMDCLSVVFGAQHGRVCP